MPARLLFSGIDIELDTINGSGIRISRIGREQAVPIASMPASASAASTTSVSRPGTETVSGGDDGKLAIPIDNSGLYRTNVSVNGVPVCFLVDTGAYSVSMSRDQANRSGVYHCRFTGISTTANGPVDVCTADNVPVEFGPHRLSNVSIAILPQMGAEVLLGMSVLRNLRMEQVDGVLTISR